MLTVMLAGNLNGRTLRKLAANNNRVGAEQVTNEGK